LNDFSGSIHKPPASIEFAPIKHALAVTVEPFKFSSRYIGVAYELSQKDKLYDFSARAVILGESTLDHKISDIVLFHRRQSGLSRNQLADLAGVGKTVIYDIEKGKETIRFSTLQNVLKALNIKITFTSPLMGVLNEES
jgi:DNA-binding XRE family transcriptional regulator